MVQLCTQFLQEPTFDQLRTKEQLGYVVHVGARFDNGVVGLRLLVQSAAHAPPHLDARIDAFLNGVPALLEGMSPAEFAAHKQAKPVEKLRLRSAALSPEAGPAPRRDGAASTPTPARAISTALRGGDHG